MSPLTALFGGMCIIGGIALGSITAVTLYGMKIVDGKASNLIELVRNTLDNVPEIIASLPPAVGDALNDRRAPEYAKSLDVQASLSPSGRGNGLRAVAAITNNGDKVVSMLAIRVVALDRSEAPVEEWTDVVATPIAVDDQWRGVLMPGETRHVVLDGFSLPPSVANAVTTVAEISELRVWESKAGDRSTGDRS